MIADAFGAFALVFHEFRNFRLHEEIEDFYEWMRPSKVEQMVRHDVFSRIRNVILDLYPEAVVSSRSLLPSLTVFYERIASL